MTSAQRFSLSATAVAVPGPALNALLDKMGSATPAQLTIAASSTFGSVPALRPQNLLSSSAPAGWIAASPDATLHLQWTGPRTIGSIQLTPYGAGIAAQPTQVLISSPEGSRDVPVPQSGALTFAPLRTNQLDISFPGVMDVTAYNPLVGRAQQLPVGLAGLSIPALAGLSTGQPSPGTPFTLGCGQGPPLTVDGHTYATSVSGIASDLTNLTPLPLRVCGPRIHAGAAGRTHYLTSPGTGLPLTVTDLSLAASATRATATAGRSLHIGSWGTEYRTATIGAGRAVLPGGSPGGQRRLDGHPERAPARAGDAGRLAAGLRRARWPGRPGRDGFHSRDRIPPGAGREHSRGLPRDRGGGVAVAAPPDTAVAAPGGFARNPAEPDRVLARRGGRDRGARLDRRPAALAVPVVLMLGWWSPRWVPLLAFGAMCAAGAVTISGLSHGAQYGFGAFSWAAQAAALIALAAALTPLRPVPGAVATAGGPADAGGPRRGAGGRTPMTTLGETARAPASSARRPLAAIEELDLYLDSTHEPNLVQLETHARGHLDRPALAAAVTAVLAASPDAGRRLAPASRWDRRLHWQTSAGAPLVVAGWRSPAELTALRERLFAAPLSLYGATFRLILAVGPEHDVVILQVHHAAFDGISAIALLSAISGAYTERAGVSTEPGDPLPADPEGLDGPAMPAWLCRGPGRAIGRPVTLRRPMTLPGTVTRIAPQGASPDRPGYGFVLTSMPVPRRPRGGRGPHPTVNDLLVAALSLTVDRWDTAHGLRSGQIRITVPVNARDPEQRWQGYGNLSRLIRVSTQPGERTDPAVLLAQGHGADPGRQAAAPGRDRHDGAGCWRPGGPRPSSSRARPGWPAASPARRSPTPPWSPTWAWSRIRPASAVPASSRCGSRRPLRCRAACPSARPRSPAACTCPSGTGTPCWTRPPPPPSPARTARPSPN